MGQMSIGGFKKDVKNACRLVRSESEAVNNTATEGKPAVIDKLMSTKKL